MKSLAVMTNWKVKKFPNGLLLDLPHRRYLEQFLKRFNQVFLVCPVVNSTNLQEQDSNNIIEYDRKKLRLLPLSDALGYVSSYKNFPKLIKIISRIPKDTLFYCRVPDPLTWIPGILGRKTIYHLVGDPIEVIWKSEVYSILRKLIYTTGYIPEILLYWGACKFNKQCKIIVNGEHLRKKLQAIALEAKVVISSTLVSSDFYLRRFRKKRIYKLLFVGYLRHSKGITLIPALLEKLVKRNINFYLTIVGDGPLKEQLKIAIRRLGLLNKVTFLGHINDWNKLLSIYRDNDIFIFPSLSEGSPRVILEAMANSLLVVSTPVGSLPYVFRDGHEIMYASTPEEFADKITYALRNIEVIDSIIYKAYKKVLENFTIEKFMEELFEEF